jgi:hypothetical protein
MKRTDGSPNTSKLEKPCSRLRILRDANRKLTHQIKQSKHE